MSKGVKKYRKTTFGKGWAKSHPRFAVISVATYYLMFGSTFSKGCDKDT